MDSHQKIVQLEEELNFKDGATPISLIYKSKYMEDEESYLNYSFAIMEMVVKMLQLINYNSLSDALKTLKADDEQRSQYNRTRDFLLYNTNLTLRTFSEQVMEKYLAELQDNARSGKEVLSAETNVA